MHRNTFTAFIPLSAVGAALSTTALSSAGLPPLFFVNNQDIPIIGPGEYEPSDIAVGDFNQDFLPDIVAAAQGEPRGFILIMGQPGDPSFGTPTVVVTDKSQPDENGGRGVAVADLNNDGNQDVVLSRAFSGVTVSPGNGDGTFDPAIDVLTDVSKGDLLWPLRIHTMRLDADNDLDLVIVDGRNDELYILQNDGSFNFTLTQSFPIFGTTQASVADLDGDGLDDLVWDGTGDVTFQRVHISLNQNGQLGAPFDVVIDQPDETFTSIYDVDLVDLDLDGDVDILVVGPNPQGGFLAVLRNDGTAAFPNASYITMPVAFPLDMAIADFDGDQRIDLAVLDAAGTVWFLRNETVVPGQFQFSAPFHIETNGFVTVRIIVGNLHADCDHDVIVLNKETSNIAIVENISEQLNQCTIADFDYDGLVNGSDLAYLLSEWGKAGSPADLDLSGRVEGWDLAFLLWGWQQPEP